LNVQESKIRTPFVLCIAEKPSAAKRIANALAEKGVEQITIGKESIYKIVRKNENLIITAASGHIFSVVQDGYGSEFPTYDFKWAPLYKKSRGSNEIKKDPYSQRILNIFKILKELIPKAEKIIIMTDYDQEGEVIGGIILKELGGEKIFRTAKRMKFSTLTKDELKLAYDKLLPTIDFNLFEAGVTRHYLDWLYGINLSRALMLTYKRETSKFKSLSTGRVQGPTLRFVYDREIKIKSHVPIPFWQIKIRIFIDNNPIELKIEKNFEAEKEAKRKAEEFLKGEIYIEKIEAKDVRISPPVPPNLSNLQGEIYRLYKIPPEQTLAIAEKLYLGALISYPRTDAQQYPKDLNHIEIINKLAQQKNYISLKKFVLPIKKNRPVSGKKTDPAHPAIYPTGEKPDKKLNSKEFKIYDYIVRRYFATLAEDSIETRKKIVFSINKQEMVSITITKPKKRGWKQVLNIKEAKNKFSESLEKLREGMNIEKFEVKTEQKYTTPPPRYNPSSLLKEMEKNEIGTKATRAEIINTLKKRGYLQGKESFEITELGLTVMEILKQNSPIITLPDLTRQVEQSLAKIERAEIDSNTVILQGIVYLHKVLLDLHNERKNIGQALDASVDPKNQNKQNYGTCPICKTGKLEIRIARNTGKRFLGCTNYFNTEIKCNASFPLPQKGKIEKTNKKCPADGYTMVKVITNKRIWYWCINPECPERKKWGKNSDFAKINNEGD